MSKAAVDAIYCANVLSEVGVQARPVLHGDSTAAQRNCEKLGLGQIRHLGVQNMFVKEAVKSK
eukprot:12874329-Alexandrium_andersonii.AAC.1